ncbi:response regulator [Methanospirillum sp.]|uniref:response regulator n=1 Tax=Methanospirillum sp. TaxID=45200 RepID=UPI00261F36ED|nr:response regulator [Methanospirillum sp.]
MDDSIEMMDLIKTILERDAQISVRTCNNPKKVSGHLSKGMFNVLISDFAMPGMNGMELFRQVRSEGYTLPCILYSCYSQEEIQRSCPDDVPYHYIQKKGHIIHQCEKIRSLIMR